MNGIRRHIVKMITTGFDNLTGDYKLTTRHIAHTGGPCNITGIVESQSTVIIGRFIQF
ncbi:hypothetical protein THIOM_000344 [Candidatus Thiomargarita nelsonii]|uniref:Uncharacterized protein n=1 Tax=Candidatus Thiomargarita nelsonii TaxID=1003181 RepID=A0A176S701_9GAMM|nr:hypothetical protein THIOM_000344 [Candidatus Thiomargarita nelsonii]